MAYNDKDRFFQNIAMKQYVKDYITRFGIDVEFDEILKRYEHKLPDDEYGYFEQREALRGIFRKEMEQAKTSDFGKKLRKAIDDRAKNYKDQSTSSAFVGGEPDTGSAINKAILG